MPLRGKLTPRQAGACGHDVPAIYICTTHCTRELLLERVVQGDTKEENPTLYVPLTGGGCSVSAWGGQLM